MKLFRDGLALALAVSLVACQGSFSNGTSTPGGAVMPPGPPGPSPAAVAATAAASPGASDSGTYPFSQAASGLNCPPTQGFSCVFKFNIPPATPSPVPTATPTPKHAVAHSSSKRAEKGKPVKHSSSNKPVTLSLSKRATPSPSPAPSPSANASASPSGSASPKGSPAPATGTSPSASPTPIGATVTIKLDALPKDAPAMTNPDPKAVATTALLAVRMTVDGDVTLNGAASADFTLPQEQIGGRGFAIQLFNETHHKKKTIDTYLGSYAQSTLSGTTLHFEFTPPPLTVKKGETWLFVLYGDERPSATGSPAPAGSPSTPPSGAPESPIPSPTATANP